MANSNERIAAGLNHRENGPALSAFVALQPGDDAKSKLPSPSLLRERAHSARNKLAQLQQVRDHVAKATQQAHEQAEREVESLKSSLSKDQRRGVIAQRERDARKRAAEHWQPRRDAAIAALRDYGAGLDTLKSLWGSPSAMLTSRVLGSEKSARYQAQLASAGPQQLAVTLRLAVVQANSDLAFAALSAADARGFKTSDLVEASRDDIAAAVLGSAWEETADALRTLETAGHDAVVIEREITSGRRDPLATVSRGLRDHDAGEGEPAEGEGADNDAT